MFWKKGTKEPSPKDLLAERISKMAPGESISYRLHETYGGGLAVVQLNPTYPLKGKKFTMSIETLVDGKPSGKRNQLWDTDKPLDLAKWIFERDPKPFD